jgi:hypothetical protein
MYDVHAELMSVLSQVFYVNDKQHENVKNEQKQSSQLPGFESGEHEELTKLTISLAKQQ